LEEEKGPSYKPLAVDKSGEKVGMSGRDCG